MAKRRAEDTLPHDSPSKRCYRSLCGVDVRLGSMAPTGGVSPPSLLALLGTRCRKRPRYFEEAEREEEEGAVYRQATHCDTRKHAAIVMTVHASGGLQERRSSGALTSSKKRPREDCAASETVITNADDKAGEEINSEDCTYNSFQYWRVPLPELDLSLLEEASDQSQTQVRAKVKDSSSDAMET